MKTQKFITIAFIAIMLCALAIDVSAAERAGSIDLPDRIQITKDNDVSAAMLSKLFGTEWQAIAGGFASDAAGGAGKFAGAFVLCLSILNAITMFFVSAMVLYTWGVAAIETAHYGKLGGTTYSNPWLPIRHLTAFSITVPVSAGGLSLLQYSIIAVVSFSINLANVAWDKAGGYLITHAQQGVIDNVPPFIE